MAKDFPFHEVVAKARTFVAKGHDVYQKFTCSGCGARLAIDQPNVFHETGTCDRCDAITDIKSRGCNYSVHMRLS